MSMSISILRHGLRTLPARTFHPAHTLRPTRTPRLALHGVRHNSRTGVSHRKKDDILYAQMLEENYDEEFHFFAFEKGRFFWNEGIRLRERFVIFRTAAMAAVVAQSVGKEHGQVAEFRKLEEGDFNRVFLATMDDGLKVIFKIPYWSAVPKKYTTASEVATMKLLRGRGIPVPKIYGWSSDASGPVGAEYIIMEYIEGASSRDHRFEAKPYEKQQIVEAIVDMEKKLAAIPFANFGSIYFKDDVPEEKRLNLFSKTKKLSRQAAAEQETYCIGPIAHPQFWCMGRDESDHVYGPWKNYERYLKDVGENQSRYAQGEGSTITCKYPHNTVEKGGCNPTDYSWVINDYQALVPYLINKTDRDMTRPSLRHPDLRDENVHIDPVTFQVTAFLDWQHSVVIPKALAIGYPAFCKDPGPILDAADVKLPFIHEKPGRASKIAAATLTELYKPQLESIAERIAKQNREDLVFHNMYKQLNPDLYQHMRDPVFLARQHLVHLAGREWQGETIRLKAAMARIRELWKKMPGNTKNEPFPLKSFTPEMLERLAGQEAQYKEMDLVVNTWRQLLNAREDGYIEHQYFGGAHKRNRSFMWELQTDVSGGEWKKMSTDWPYKNDNGQIHQHRGLHDIPAEQVYKYEITPREMQRSLFPEKYAAHPKYIGSPTVARNEIQKSNLKERSRIAEEQRLTGSFKHRPLGWDYGGTKRAKRREGESEFIRLDLQR